MENDDSEEEDVAEQIEQELEDFEIDADEVGSEDSAAEHKEVEKVVGVDPAEGSVETVRHKMVTENGDLYEGVVRKRLQCPSCDRIMVEEPVAPGSCPECTEDFWDE